MKVVQPREELRPYVRYYWILESTVPFSVLTFPIGCPQIIFHRKTPLYIPELSSRQDKFTISGQVNFPAHIVSDDDTEMIVAVFYPHTIGRFIATPPSEFYNSEISGFDLGNRNLNSLANTILDCDDTSRAVRMIEAWLLSRLSRQGVELSYQPRIGYAVTRLMADPSTPVTQLADGACLSPRQFRRVFYSQVGMPPKEYARIVRFQKSMWLLQCGKHEYADIAYSCGYSDQAHFIREFRQFSSLTPKQLVEYQLPYSDLYTFPAY